MTYYYGDTKVPVMLQRRRRPAGTSCAAPFRGDATEIMLLLIDCGSGSESVIGL